MKVLIISTPTYWMFREPRIGTREDKIQAVPTFIFEMTLKIFRTIHSVLVVSMSETLNVYLFNALHYNVIFILFLPLIAFYFFA